MNLIKMKNKKIKIALKVLRDKMELFDIFQQDDEVGLALSDLEKEINKK
jgi:hypothetical protein